MNVSAVQTPPTDLQLLLRLTQQKREAARDSQDAQAGTAATSDITKPLPELGKDAAKLVTDLKALLIGQQSNTGSTASTTSTASATSETSASTLTNDGKRAGGKRAGGQHRYHAPFSETLPADVPPASTSTASSPTNATFLVQTPAKALQAYTRGTQATADAATPFATA